MKIAKLGAICIAIFALEIGVFIGYTQTELIYKILPVLLLITPSIPFIVILWKLED